MKAIAKICRGPWSVQTRLLKKSHCQSVSACILMSSSQLARSLRRIGIVPRFLENVDDGLAEMSVIPSFRNSPRILV